MGVPPGAVYVKVAVGVDAENVKGNAVLAWLVASWSAARMPVLVESGYPYAVVTVDPSGRVTDPVDAV